ncbi:AMP-binding protein [Hymenobacter sp. ASUV-10]|uniref:AMP-binding protein n=1 Tax=Hymenobacter aranciens TaxID=3063996 RepID=A0ABT9BGI1_9BACT|nr:AMP-binding protein [Hymenobacter sp. ASUV-10]MDO7875623.1 AMP-binding protein [Hymenobacter sp. ASUV-10]
MSANFYAHIATTLRAQPATTLLTWPALTPAEAGDYVPPAHYSGAEIAAAVAAMRQRLAAAGVQPGQRVLLLVPVSFELIGALLGVLAHGAVAVLPPAKASPGQLLRLARREQLAAIVLARSPGFEFWLTSKIFSLKLLDARKLTGHFSDLPPQAVLPSQPALITHTSGSTGQPKQIVRTHAVLSAQHAVLKQIFPPWPGQQDFPLFPNVLLHNLASGAASVLPQVPWGNFADFHPPLVAAQLRDFEVHTLTGNVFYFQKLLPEFQQEPGGFPAVRALGVGGSPVPEWLVHKLQVVFSQATIYVIYGSSEAEPIAVRPLTARAESPALGYAVGPVHPSLELRLEPLGELELPGGERRPVGEIQVRGPHVASPTPGNWLRTGDFGYRAADGQLYLTGRAGNEALRYGVQHYQLEHVLQHLPGVQRVAARPGAAGFAVYVQGEATETAIRTALAAYFPAAVCAEVHFRAELPVDHRHHSKIRYGELH